MTFVAIDTLSVNSRIEVNIWGVVIKTFIKDLKFKLFFLWHKNTFGELFTSSLNPPPPNIHDNCCLLFLSVYVL